jgi:hypothetical protein
LAKILIFFLAFLPWPAVNNQTMNVEPVTTDLTWLTFFNQTPVFYLWVLHPVAYLSTGSL